MAIKRCGAIPLIGQQCKTGNRKERKERRGRKEGEERRGNEEGEMKQEETSFLRWKSCRLRM